MMLASGSFGSPSDFLECVGPQVPSHYLLQVFFSLHLQLHGVLLAHPWIVGNHLGDVSKDDLFLPPVFPLERQSFVQPGTWQRTYVGSSSATTKYFQIWEVLLDILGKAGRPTLFFSSSPKVSSFATILAFVSFADCSGLKTLPHDSLILLDIGHITHFHLLHCNLGQLRLLTICKNVSLGLVPSPILTFYYNLQICRC